jgi:hypothetical protein
MRLSSVLITVSCLIAQVASYNQGTVKHHVGVPPNKLSETQSGNYPMFNKLMTRYVNNHLASLSPEYHVRWLCR